MMMPPVRAFDQLDLALARAMALSAALDQVAGDPEDKAKVEARLEEAMGSAIGAYAHLVAGSRAIAEIRAFLLATHGGQPG